MANPSTSDKRSQAGKKGAESLNSNPEKKSAASEKAAQTRAPNAFKEMGREGGQKGGKTSGSNRSGDR